MTKYYLTNAAVQDLEEIVEYTLEEWGGDQVEIYRKRLKSRLKLVVCGGNTSMVSLVFSAQIKEVNWMRCSSISEVY